MPKICLLILILFLSKFSVATTWGGPGGDYTDQIIRTSDKGMLLLGDYTNASEDYYLIKFDSALSVQWIKSFGDTMVAQHTTAQGDLKTLGTSVGVNVKDSVDADHTTLLQNLQGLSGRAFDSTYIINQIADHQKTVTDFQAELSSGSRTEVKDFANKYLPKIQMHLQKADSIATEMNFK